MNLITGSKFWCETKDGDPDGLKMFHQHYSYKPYKDGRRPKLFVGPGQKMVLISPSKDALFVWRKFISGDGQCGVNCAVFRNTSQNRASEMILDAERLAHERWPNERLYTYINTRKVASKNPGYCFQMAGWRKVGITKWNKLHIYEKFNPRRGAQKKELERMTTELATPANGKQQSFSLLRTMATKYDIDPAKFYDTIRATVMPSSATEEEMVAFLIVANTYNLNPILREIYAFPKKGGGIQPVISIDGWISLANQNPQYDGVEFSVCEKEGLPYSVTCSIYRKDRTRPTTIVEKFTECKRNTDPWNSCPTRMLRHKSFIQCSRMAFGFSGIMDDDEAESIKAVSGKIIDSAPAPTRTEGVKNALKNRLNDTPVGITLPATPPAETAPTTEMTNAEFLRSKQSDPVIAAPAAEPNPDEVAAEKKKAAEAKKAQKKAEDEAKKAAATCKACLDTGKNSRGNPCPICSGPKTGVVDPVVEKALVAATEGSDPFDSPSPAAVVDPNITALQNLCIECGKTDDIGAIKDLARAAWKIINEEQRQSVLTSMQVLDFVPESKTWNVIRWRTFIKECSQNYVN